MEERSVHTGKVAGSIPARTTKETARKLAVFRFAGRYAFVAVPSTCPPVGDLAAAGSLTIGVGVLGLAGLARFVAHIVSLITSGAIPLRCTRSELRVWTPAGLERDPACRVGVPLGPDDPMESYKWCTHPISGGSRQDKWDGDPPAETTAVPNFH